MSERQQLAEAIRFTLVGRAYEPGPIEPQVADAAAVAVEPFLVAAERAGYENGKVDGQRLGYADAMRQHGLIEHESPETYEDGVRDGYERCKRDASKGIEALSPMTHAGTGNYKYSDQFKREVLAVVAALNATQQEASDG